MRSEDMSKYTVDSCEGEWGYGGGGGNAGKIPDTK